MNEFVLRFGDGLVGIYTPSGMPGHRPGLVLVNSGVVHRAGPNRLYVNVARQLAAAGYPVLRFDLSAIGDSSPRSDSLSFEKSTVSETAAAMAALGAKSGCTAFILCGICSGADISFVAARHNPAVVGAVLINGRGLHGVTDDSGDAIAASSELEASLRTGISAHYLWSSALFNPASWRKLLSGQANPFELLRVVSRQALSRLVSSAQVPENALELRAALLTLLSRGTALLMVYSAGDPAIDYMKLMLGKDRKKIAAEPNFAEIHMPRADHTFTARHSRDELIGALRSWADAHFSS